MFPKAQRITRTDFPALGRGKRLSSAHFSLSFSPLNKGYAVVVGKTTAKRSVDRHKIKRRALAALRSLPSLPPALVVYPRASALALSAAELRAELSALISKI